MDKTQPQKLLEEIIPHDENEKFPSDPEALNDAPKFPTIETQNEYWRQKEAADARAAEPTPPRKWSLARRRKYNATVAKKKEGTPSAMAGLSTPPAQESAHKIRCCPFCGESIERFLA